MQSNGGMSTFATASRKAVTTVLSGPAGGVTAGAYACRMTGFQNIITFDMGGTSCDVALIRDGEPFLASRGKIEERDLARLPMMDIHTVSAGVLRSPRSTVSGTLPRSPAPKARSRPAGRPTAAARSCRPSPTATLVMGHLSEDNSSAGTSRLGLERARAAVKAKVANPLGTSA